MAEPVRNPVGSDSQERGIQSSVIRRSPEQELARIQRARSGQPQVSSVRPLRPVAPYDNQTSLPPSGTTRAQQQVRALRTARENRLTPPQIEEGSNRSSFNIIGYTIAFTIALCKDLLDFVGIGSLPLIGWIVATIASTLIFITLLTTDSSGSMASSRRMIQRVIVLAGTIVVEGLFFGLNFLPLETGAVLLLALLDKGQGGLQKVTKVIKYTPVGRSVKGVLK